MKTLIKYTVGVPLMALFLAGKYSFKQSEWTAGDAFKLVLCMVLSVGYTALGLYVAHACGYDLNNLR
jgi:hypothetical protein